MKVNLDECSRAIAIPSDFTSLYHVRYHTAVSEENDCERYKYTPLLNFK